MIEPKELRVGNYYGRNGVIAKVTPNVIQELFDPQNRRWVKPIELTEQWLIDFNFSTHDYHDGVIRYIKGRFEFWSQNGSLWLHKYFGVTEDFETLPTIEHVHKLQNAWYVLEREELKLKEEV